MNSKNKISLKKLPPTMNVQLSEAYGALIGDGCLSTYYSNYKKKQKYLLLYTGHTHDFDYYKQIIQPIFIKEFGLNGSIFHRSKNRGNCLDYWVYSKNVFKWFKDIGFPVGKKLILNIPKMIMKDNELAIACVRGIFNTDGSIYPRYSKQYSMHAKKYNYLNIEFKMNSFEVISQIKEILERNNIRTSKIRKNKKSAVLNIHDQKHIKLFFDLIKPSNPYHRERFLNLNQDSSK